MCDLQEGPKYDAAYSYGVGEQGDAWGWHVSGLLHVPVHQYDCTLGAAPPSCTPPCRSVFHNECVSWQRRNVSNDDRRVRRFETLDEHLEANGHGDALDGSLLAKIDIEGYEWQVLQVASQTTLRKFRQIVVEFHMPLLRLMDAARCEVRLATMQNLLQSFALVHVHIANTCGEANCFEALLVHRDFVQKQVCRWPQRHPLDQPTSPGMPDQDIAELAKSALRAPSQASGAGNTRHGRDFPPQDW